MVNKLLPNIPTGNITELNKIIMQEGNWSELKSMFPKETRKETQHLDSKIDQKNRKRNSNDKQNC